MKETNIFREELAALLERYGDSLDSFDALRPDSYEQVLARQPEGLHFLECFYVQLHSPGQTLAEAAAKCPTWPLGTKRERQRPSPNILSQVGERMRTRAALARISPVGQFLTDLRKELKATPLGDNQAILDGVCGAVGQKLMSDIRAGEAIDVKLMDRLQQQRIIEQNEKRLAQNDARIANDAKRIALLETKLKEVEEKKKKIEEALSAGNKSGAITPEAYKRVEEMLNLL